VEALPHASGDASLLEQIWLNLIGNAAKYSATRVERDLATYEVTDNGVGFDPRYAHRLFGVFQRLHGAEIEGTGIGLALCKNFVERHGGLHGPAPPSRLQLVLLDLEFPKLDGIEVLRAMRADPRTSATPVVMLTSSREERDLAASYELRANSYVVKPVSFDEFLAAVEQVGLYWTQLNQRPHSSSIT
jgi:CheY-like chemotaxis protein